MAQRNMYQTSVSYLCIERVEYKDGDVDACMLLNIVRRSKQQRRHAFVSCIAETTHYIACDGRLRLEQYIGSNGSNPQPKNKTKTY